MSLFLIRSTLRGTWRIGLAIGAGIACIDTLYAGVGAAGVGPALQVESVRVVIGCIGAAVLIVLGLRTLRFAFRVRIGAELAEEVRTARRAYLTALAATASNPLTIALWTGAFAAGGAATHVHSAVSVLLLLLGIGLGSMSWFTILSTFVSVGRKWVRPSFLRVVDACSGCGLIGFGGLLGYRALNES
jgi:putative LysE/RhtB family amino acid efflux pump